MLIRRTVPRALPRGLQHAVRDRSTHVLLLVPLSACTPTDAGAHLGPRALGPCATRSMLTYYRTSRSLHFPFGAVCSLSGAQPEIWSVSWKPPVHRAAFRLFVAFPSVTSFVVSPAGGRGGPGLLRLPGHPARAQPRARGHARSSPMCRCRAGSGQAGPGAHRQLELSEQRTSKDTSLSSRTAALN